MIHWEIKFDYTSKWYMHCTESGLEYGTQKLLWYFEMQADHLISVRQSDLVIVNKKKKKEKKRTCQTVNFAVSAD